MTQRASVSPRTEAMPSRIAWSSALRFSGLEIVRRRTPSAGWSWSSCPGMGDRSLRVAAELLHHPDQRARVGGAGDQRAFDARRALAGAHRLEVALELGELGLRP